MSRRPSVFFRCLTSRSAWAVSRSSGRPWVGGGFTFVPLFVKHVMVPTLNPERATVKHLFPSMKICILDSGAHTGRNTKSDAKPLKQLVDRSKRFHHHDR